ncbi:hypothetical protein CBR_g12531 [Chara braunii]|uniref:Uncharacterized protein n=1 Tax=Chara braunii TaxID=69332 RepID=A0A388JSQ6_CHABU|nr:hypothetical protein CBR_g12531 [Chara braunii]|eukprot:GBG60793.1 hypothetical protein CBR_g12531 [Chara braunii]
MDYAVILRKWHFKLTESNSNPTDAEKTKEDIAMMIALLIATCNWQQQELQRLARVIDSNCDQQDGTNRGFHTHIGHLENLDTATPDSKPYTSQPSTRQLEQRIDHMVATIGNLGTFAEPATISQHIASLTSDLRTLQQRPSGSSDQRPYKMPNFNIEKFDDYTKQDPLAWWQGFTTQSRFRDVPEHLKLATLYLNTTGACQIWLNHLISKEGVNMDRLHAKLDWDIVEALWKARFIIQDEVAKGINKDFQMYQGSQPTYEWLNESQTIVAILDLNLPFTHIQCEFFNARLTP